MKTIIELISNEVMTAFKEAGYDENMGKVTLSNRPDLCEYQCNGAMAGAKVYHKAPIMIANDVVAKLAGSKVLEMAEAVNPGFINLKVSGAYMAQYLEEMRNSEKMGVEEAKDPQTMILDYGGPNVAKPLHVGHLRSAIIGESIKRMGRYLGHKVIGDVHLGDWGLQMGLIITELHKRKPELVYFQEDYEGEYPTEAPFTISELEEIYPAASGKSKEDESYKAEALEATHQLQMGNRGYRALWKHILQVSVTDLKKNYANLKVDFDLWNGESDVQDTIAPMVQKLKEQGLAYEDQGAVVVDVKEETDTKEVPPCMILKSDGAALYTTTDLATIVERMEKYNPDEIMYVVDKRQEMHFVQVFRCAKKAGMVKDDTKLTFLGFGTMNGKDGKPFKTREGGVMRLENLIRDINEEMYKKIVDNRSIKEEDARATAKIVAPTIQICIQFLIFHHLFFLHISVIRIPSASAFFSFFTNSVVRQNSRRSLQLFPRIPTANTIRYTLLHRYGIKISRCPNVPTKLTSTVTSQLCCHSPGTHHIISRTLIPIFTGSTRLEGFNSSIAYFSA